MEVYMIHMNGDGMNLCYYITRDLATKPGILIDVAEPQKVREFMDVMDITIAPSMILSTHKHWDHS